MCDILPNHVACAAEAVKQEWDIFHDYVFFICTYTYILTLPLPGLEKPSARLTKQSFIGIHPCGYP